jgi:hypothetical protein
MLFREIIAVCSEIHAKLIQCVGTTWNFLMLNPAVRIVTAGLWRVEDLQFGYFLVLNIQVF